MRRSAVIVPILAGILVVACLVGAVVRAGGYTSPFAQATPYPTGTSAAATATSTATVYATTTAAPATTTAPAASPSPTVYTTPTAAATTAPTAVPAMATASPAATVGPISPTGPNQLPYTGAASNTAMLLLLGMAFLGLGVAWTLWPRLDHDAAVRAEVSSDRRDQRH